MSETVRRELTCIRCPLGCRLTVTGVAGDLKVTGNTCPRGEEYGIQEVTHPTRVVTSTVPVSGGVIARVPVKTAGDIPKETIFACMKEICAASVSAPVAIGDVVIKDCAGTGVDIVACRDVEAA